MKQIPIRIGEAITIRPGAGCLKSSYNLCLVGLVQGEFQMRDSVGSAAQTRRSFGVMAAGKDAQHLIAGAKESCVAVIRQFLQAKHVPIKGPLLLEVVGNQNHCV